MIRSFCKTALEIDSISVFFKKGVKKFDLFDGVIIGFLFYKMCNKSFKCLTLKLLTLLNQFFLRLLILKNYKIHTLFHESRRIFSKFGFHRPLTDKRD